MKKFNFSFYKSIGFYILLLYIFLTYIPQIFFHLLFHKHFLIHYNAANYNPFLILVVIAFFFFFLIITDIVIPRINIKITLSMDLIKILNFLSFILIILFLISSIYFYFHYSISFRNDYRLRNIPILIKNLIFLKEFIWFYVFLQFVKVIRGKKLNKFIKFNLLLILIGWILTLTASQSIPFVLILLFLFNEKLLMKIMISKINMIKFITISILTFIFIIIAIFFGYADKWGFKKTFEYFTNIHLLKFIIIHTLVRLSTSFEATLSLFVNHFQDFDLQLKVIQGFVDNFLYRFSLITHFFSYHLISIDTINRINFFVLFTPLHWHLKFAGASPGLLASIFYIPIFPFNFLFMAIYVLIILRSLNKYIPYKQNYFNIFGKIIIFYFTFKLFESPLDMFYIIEPKFFYVLLFITGSLFYKKGIKNDKTITQKKL